MKTCKNCQHWKNKQAHLGYLENLGTCVSPVHRYDSCRPDNNEVFVFDKDNVHKTHYHGSHMFENIKNRQIERSIYLLITGADFGCINFEEVKR